MEKRYDGFMFFDSHAHLTCHECYFILPEILERAKRAKVSMVANICTDPLTLERGIELAKREPWIVNTGATTPHDVEKEGELAFPEFERAARDGLLKAVGETGLDYHYEHSNRALQQEFFIRYLHLADACGLPVVIHCREAFDDLFAIAGREFKGRAVLHCFTGEYEEAKRAVDLGWSVSFSGIVTFKKSEALREVAKRLPVESLLIETDTPYLAPQSKRGMKNEPSFISETCLCLAELKGISLDEMAAQTAQNARAFFSIS